MVFAVSDSIHADSVTINEILEPMEWNFAEGCVIVNSPKNEEIFHVYAAPEFRYMYSFGKKGEGPGEFFSPCHRIGGRGCLDYTGELRPKRLTRTATSWGQRSEPSRFRNP